MLTARIRIAAYVFLALCATLLLVSCTNRQNDSAGMRLQPFKDVLEKQGFLVQEGKLTKFDLVTLCCAGKTPNCMANNAGAPYMTFKLPNSPDQTVENTLPWGFRLGANEAVIIVGRTPPPMAYYSYQPFRIIMYSEKDATRKIIFEPVGDTINNLTIRTDGSSSQPFDREVIVIITADQDVDSRVRSAARVAGYPAGIINTSVVPTAVTRLGIDEKADEFAFVHRMFLPEPGQEETFENYLNTDQTTLRVTLKDKSSLKPFPVPDLRVRGTGTTEMDLLPAMEDLRKAILGRYKGLPAKELTTSVWLTDGFDGLQREINQYGPTRDALYLRTDPLFKLTTDPNDFLIVYGVNHEATGKATYSNFTAYVDPNILLGMVTANSRQIKGSALDYLPNHPKANLLYAWKVARNCQGDPHCLEVKIEGCERVNLDLLPDLWMGFRLYLEPQTKVGPAFTEVVYDRVIHFRPGP